MIINVTWDIILKGHHLIDHSEKLNSFENVAFYTDLKT